MLLGRRGIWWMGVLATAGVAASPGAAATVAVGAAGTPAAVAADPARGPDVRVDGRRRTGTVRPLHGVNNGPLTCGETVDVSAEYRALATPLARLHDAEWPAPDVVDVRAVFPDASADPARAESYRFARTDAYVGAIVATGTGIVYRLGESIEHARRKERVHPPADPARWAEVCLGIIRHYNEGWADGFRYGIRYWEIWNEPENRPAMWTGSDADYYRLYTTASRAIKARFPDLRVGGPSVGATGEVRDGRLRATPFLEGFLGACRAAGAPLDFFSWHTYSDDPTVYAAKARAVRAWLDERGFAKTEVHLNEWNYLPDGDWGPMLAAGQAVRRQRWYERMGGPEGAAFAAYVLLDLQDAPVDAANYYSGDTGAFGLFNRHGVPKKTYYALKAVRMLAETPLRLHTAGGDPGRWTAGAGVDAAGTRMTVLVSRLRPGDGGLTLTVEPLPWRGPTRWQARRLDAEHDLDVVAEGTAAGEAVRLDLALAAPGVLVVRLAAEGAEGGP